jgi:hypothetical protein
MDAGVEQAGAARVYRCRVGELQDQELGNNFPSSNSKAFSKTL